MSAEARIERYEQAYQDDYGYEAWLVRARRGATLAADTPLGPAGTAFGAHEFHYASITREGDADRLFAATDATGAELGGVGLRRGKVMGSFIHLIDAR